MLNKQTQTTPDTADPQAINISLSADGKWDWNVFYEYDTFDQDGTSKTLDEAIECVRGVIENGRTKP